jgi:hypothetical protein
VNLNFECRKQFRPFFESDKRWALIVAHRRCGKTVACIQRVIIKALEEGKSDGRYGYIAPFREQAKTVAWEYLKRFSEPVVGSADDFRESDLQVKLVTGQTIRLFGADNPNALRGTYFDGVVLDEYADMKPSLWGEVIRPTLSDRHGWATFIGTPRGRNAFYEQYVQAGEDPEWFRLVLKASETGLLSEAELADARKTMSENQYEQEYECSFDAAVIGAVYAKELKIARDQGRVRKVPYDGAKLVFSAFDIGRRDSTAIWFYQVVSGEIRVLDYFEDSMEAAPYYASVLKARGYKYDTIYLPHDADNETAATDLTFAGVMRSNGFRIVVLPKLGLEDGINAARMLFPKIVFDADKCQAGLEALQNYKWGYNERMGERKTEPVHDWASHGADAFRYMAQATRIGTEDRPKYKPIQYLKRAYV